MKKFLCSVLLCGMAALPTLAQGGAPPAAASQTPPAAPADPLSTFVKGQFRNATLNLIGSAEQMPEANFSMKLGTTAEVRTFASLLGHVINANYLFCSFAKGEANPNKTDYERDATAQTKDSLVKGMHAAMDYCQPAYDALTDAGFLKTVTIPGRGGAPGREVPASQMLLQNVIHDNEEYGNLVGYFRQKDLVPPSTARAGSGGGRRGN